MRALQAPLRQCPKQEQHPDWSELLVKAVNTPGVISDAYARFWNYSVSNQLLAMFECFSRKLDPGPIHTYRGWQKLGRQVRKGEKGITLCMPRTVKRKRTESLADNPELPAQTSGDGAERGAAAVSYTTFLYRPFWFVLSQTDGEPYVPLALPEWDESAAMHALMIDRVPFQHLDGNCQGYAVQRQFAVSPIAYLPHRTCLHEIAHIVLGHTQELQGLSDADEQTPRDIREVEAEAVALICCQSLGLPGAEFSRGYLQHWLGRQKIEDRSARKVFKAADAILRAWTSSRNEQHGRQLR